MLQKTVDSQNNAARFQNYRRKFLNIIRKLPTRFIRFVEKVGRPRGTIETQQFDKKEKKVVCLMEISAMNKFSERVTHFPLDV